MKARYAGVLRRHTPVTLTLIGALVAVGLRGQEPVDTFEGRESVLEVQVPVNVLMRDGTPVRGLTVDDFRVLEKGREQKIVDFQVVDLDLIRPDLQRVTANTMRENIPAAARRNVLLLFDLSFSTPSAIIKAREAARRFVLESLHPSDLVGLATHSVDQGARLVVTFTPDRVQLARGIDTLGAPRLTEGIRDPLKFVLPAYASEIDRLSSRDSDNSTSSEVRGMQESLLSYLRIIGKQMAKVETSYARGRVSSWSRSMGTLAAALDSIKGRKHVVYFSEGFDGRLLLGRRPDGFDPEQQRDRQELDAGNHWMVDNDDIFGNTSLQSDFADMLGRFRRSDVVLHAVDTSGLTALGPRGQATKGVGQDALFYISNETGGSLFANSNRLQEDLVQMLEASTVTYLLTISPSDPGVGGEYHPIKVKGDVPRGARLVHRKGYFTPRPFEELAPIEKGLLASGAIAAAEPVSDIRIDVLAAAFNAGAEMGYVPIIIEIDGDSLLHGQVGDQLSVELYTYVNDAKGEMKDFFTQLVTINIPGEKKSFGSRGLKYYGHVELEAGDYLVRVLVRNAETGRTGVQAVPVTVSAFGEEDPIVLPPFFVETARDWFLVREQRSSTGGSVVYPFTVKGEPYVPAVVANLRKNEQAKICVVGYNLGADRIQLAGRILDQQGTVIDGGELELVERTITGIEGLDKLLATFESRGLEAGRYELEVAIIAENSGLLSRASIPFTVIN